MKHETRSIRVREVDKEVDGVYVAGASKVGVQQRMSYRKFD
jgi:hypothetical protein